jgi:hypothetical protein
MVQVLMTGSQESSKTAKLMPLANLFSKHVGGVLERYKISESACETLIDGFVEWTEAVGVKSQKCDCRKLNISI